MLHNFRGISAARKALKIYSLVPGNRTARKRSDFVTKFKFDVNFRGVNNLQHSSMNGRMSVAISKPLKKHVVDTPDKGF